MWLKKENKEKMDNFVEVNIEYISNDDKTINRKIFVNVDVLNKMDDNVKLINGLTNMLDDVSEITKIRYINNNEYISLSFSPSSDFESIPPLPEQTGVFTKIDDIAESKSCPQCCEASNTVPLCSVDKELTVDDFESMKLKLKETKKKLLSENKILKTKTGLYYPQFSQWNLICKDIALLVEFDMEFVKYVDCFHYTNIQEDSKFDINDVSKFREIYNGDISKLFTIKNFKYSSIEELNIINNVLYGTEIPVSNNLFSYIGKFFGLITHSCSISR